jgi:hypothetical protein
MPPGSVQRALAATPEIRLAEDRGTPVHRFRLMTCQLHCSGPGYSSTLEVPDCGPSKVVRHARAGQLPPPYMPPASSPVKGNSRPSRVLVVHAYDISVEINLVPLQRQDLAWQSPAGEVGERDDAAKLGRQLGPNGLELLAFEEAGAHVILR